MTSVKTDFVQKVCDAAELTYDSAKEEMDRAEKFLGVTYGEYFSNRMYELSPTQQILQARRIIALRENRALRFKKIYDDAGYSRAEVQKKIREINGKNIIRMTLLMYAKYEVYRYEGQALDDFLNLVAHRNALKKQLLAEFDKVDAGEKTYDDVRELINEFYQVIDRIMPESLYGELSERLFLSYPELKNDPDECRRAAIDMEVMRVLLSFSLSEYVAFHFYKKEIPQIREFISDEERLKVFNQVNDPACFDSLDDKWVAYNLLGRYYGRKLIMISSEDDFGEFKKICKKNDRIVLKPPCDTLGRGIRAVDVPSRFKLKEFFRELLSENNELLIEELIRPHKAISDLNPDSVNTIRLVTYFDGEKSSIQDAFMKVGQKGSFIDNGGAGGILVSVDPETGVLNSDGCDEAGVIYKKHPYTQVAFDGYQLPDWEKAIALGHELADKVPGLKYIGWDITYTADNEWVVVEGNAKTQFFGQQCTIDKGVRKEFLEAVNYK